MHSAGFVLVLPELRSSTHMCCPTRVSGGTGADILTHPAVHWHTFLYSFCFEKSSHFEVTSWLHSLDGSL